MTLFCGCKLRFAVGMTIFGRNKYHGCREHVGCKLCIMSGARVDSLVGVTKFVNSFLYIAN